MEGGRKVAKQDFCWGVSVSLFYFILKEKIGVRCVSGKDRTEHFPEISDMDQSRTRFLSPGRPRVAMGRGK